MNKSALKRFATSMRIDLKHAVKTKIDFLLSQSYKDNLALYNSNKDAITKIEECYAKEKEEFIEEVAYTWFNRLIALRFMDANGITPTSIVSTTSEHPIPKVFVEAKAGDVPEDFTLNKTLFFDLIDKKVSGDRKSVV